MATACICCAEWGNGGRLWGTVQPAGILDGVVNGFAVIPAEGKIYAPADGEISMVFDTLHAVTMTTSQGTELLIHIGLDTVTLKGEPFISHVSGGQQVKKGDLLLEADLEKIKSAGLDTITPVLICNTDDYNKINLIKEGEVSIDDEVLKIS